MLFKCNLIKANPSETEGEQLLGQAEKLLNELIGMGLQVREATQEYDKTPVIYVSEMPNAFSNRGESEEKVVLSIQNTVASYDVASLVQLRDYYAFVCEIDKQRMRMSLLGWTANIRKREVAILMGGGQSTTFRNPGPDSVLWLEQEITRTECRNKLYEHMKEFEKAGISVTVCGDCFKIVLRENDPELVRNLTPENVDEAIRIAGALTR